MWVRLPWHQPQVLPVVPSVTPSYCIGDLNVSRAAETVRTELAPIISPVRRLGGPTPRPKSCVMWLSSLSHLGLRELVRPLS